MSLGIYVHIPFCRTKCNYCHFLSAPLQVAVAEKYVEALTGEIEGLPDCASGNEEVDSIYFGGGTPSLLPPAHINRILGACRRRFALLRDCEITLEGNPGTISAQSASDLRSIGVNRISIGAQSFDNRELASVGRLHSSAAIPETLTELSRSGFENVSIDLMLGLPR